MKKAVLFTVVGAFLSVLAGGSEARKVDLESELGVKFATGYFWRGRMINDEPVVQPEFTARLAPWTFDLWGTWDLNREPDSSDRTRIDGALDYSFDWQQLRCKAGAVAHVYNDRPGGFTEDTYEAYFDMLADIPPIFPALIVYYDFGEIDGFYGALSLTYSREVYKLTDVVLRVSVGAGSKQFNGYVFAVPQDGNADGDQAGEAPDVNKPSLVDLTASISAPTAAWKRLTVTPRIEYTTLLDSDLRHAAEARGDDADQLIGSVTLAWEF